MPRTIRYSGRIAPGVWLIAAILSLFLGTGFLLLARSQPAAPSERPTLHGEAAIMHLKEHRLYDSLQAAITTSHRLSMIPVDTPARPA
jgi:hypothetical protein